MVKDWGMSEKVGLRTIESPKGLMANEPLAANTIELVNISINTFKQPIINLNDVLCCAG